MCSQRGEPARLPAPGRGPYPYMPGLQRGTGGGGGALRTARAPRLHLPASSKLRGPHHPLIGYPEWPTEGTNTTSRPTPSLPGFRPPASRPCGWLEPPITGPIGVIRASRGLFRAGMRARESPGCSRGAQGAPPRHHPVYLPRSDRGSGFKGGRPRRPGDAGTANPPPHLAPTAPTRSAAPDRPAGTLSRPCRPLEPRPRGAPRPGDHLRPAPTAAVAACLNPDPVGRCTGPTSRCPPLPSPPVSTFALRSAALGRPPAPRPYLRRRRRPEPSLRGTPRPTDQPVPLPAVAACLNPRPVGPALGRSPSPRPCRCRRCLFGPSLRGAPRLTDWPVPLPALAASLNRHPVGPALGQDARPRRPAERPPGNAPRRLGGVRGGAGRVSGTGAGGGGAAFGPLFRAVL